MRRALLPGLLLLAGCSMSMDKMSPSGAGGVPSCRTDSDCQQGEVCLDVGCAVPTQNLVVQIIPPDQSSVSTQDFDKVDASKSLDFTLGPPANLHVKGSSYPFSLAIAGTPLHLPDLPYAVSPTTVSAEGDVPVPSGNYQLRATPSDPSIPPIGAEAVLGGPGASLELDFTFLTPAEVIPLVGSLYGPGFQPDLTYTVQLMHAGGVPASQPVSTGVLDGGPLGFALSAAPADPGETLELAATPRTGIGPSVTFEGTLAGLLGLAATDGGLPLGHALPAQASGHVVDSAGLPVAGASVRLTATLPGRGHYTSAPVLTDAQGAYRAVCLHDASSPDAGGEHYQVLAVPPQGSSSAMVLGDAQVTHWSSSDVPTDFGQTVLPAPTVVQGTVTDATGQPVPGATVQATPAGDNPLPVVSASTTTAADGTYHLPLVPGGTYHFDFTPPLALQAPANARGPITLAGGSYPLDLQFSAPHVVSGHVVDPDGQPVAGALVRVFIPGVQHTADIGGQAPHSTLLARSQVLDDGSFTIVLPAPATHSK